MPPAAEKLILDCLEEMRADIRNLYDLVKGNDRPGLRQTQDELAEMRRQCAEHRAATKAALDADARRRDGWIMFFLRPLWPLVIGLLIAGMLHAARTGEMPAFP